MLGLALDQVKVSPKQRLVITLLVLTVTAGASKGDGELAVVTDEVTEDKSGAGATLDVGIGLLPPEANATSAANNPKQNNTDSLVFMLV